MSTPQKRTWSLDGRSCRRRRPHGEYMEMSLRHYCVLTACQWRLYCACTACKLILLRSHRDHTKLPQRSLSSYGAPTASISVCRAFAGRRNSAGSVL